MNGPKKIGEYPLIRQGELIEVTVLYNQLTKFAKLNVGKHVVTARQSQGSTEPLFPLAMALNGLDPLHKVWVDYQPYPKNNFIVRINDDDYYKLVKEELDFDPSQTEVLKCTLFLNELQAHSGELPWTIG